MCLKAVRIIAIALALTMVVGAFAAIAPALSAPAHLSAGDAKAIPVPERELARMKARSADVMGAYCGLMSVNGAALAAPGDIYNLGSKAMYNVGYSGKWYYNDTDPSDYMPFTKRAEGNHSELWTCDDMSYPDGDVRNAFTSRLTITDEKAKYMVKHFEDVVHPNMTAMFGPLPGKDGSNSVPASEDLPFFGTNVTTRIMIMVFNIVDENFFDSEYPRAYYGYFDPWADWYYDRTIIHVDSYDWANRTTGTSARPWDFEATVAHELEHAIMYNTNPGQVPFVDEGCAMYSEILCGYGVQDLPYANVFQHTPDISLTSWSSQGEINSIASYGAVMLFVTWLADHFGPGLIQDMVDSYPLQGMDSIDYAFEQNGLPGWDFQRAFQYWRLANLILSDTPGNGWFNYDSLDIRTTEIGGPFVNEWYPTEGMAFASASEFFGTTVTNLGYSTGTRDVGIYGTDYIRVLGHGPGWASGLDPSDLKLAFQGESLVEYGWRMYDVPAGAEYRLYDEGFEHGGALPAGWAASHPAVPDKVNVAGGGPWQVAHDGDYFVAVDGPAGPLAPDQVQFDVLTGISLDTMGLEHAALSFSLDFLPGGDYDAFRLRYRVDGEHFVTLEKWREAVSETVTLDISDLMGFDSLVLMLDFTAYAPGGHAYVDDLAIDIMGTESIWWSGDGDMQDHGLATSLDLTGMEEAVLSLDTWWSIEDYWDFGFLQVSADGEEWTSVGNEWTTYDYLTDQERIFSKMPGITGTSWDWVTMSFDLGAWAGSVVQVRLKYMTDQYTNYEGWFLSAAYLNGEPLDMAAWAPDTPTLDNSWLVTLYFPGALGMESRVYMLPIMATLTMDEALDTALRTVSSFAQYPEMYILVSPVAAQSDYGLSFEQHPMPGAA